MSRHLIDFVLSKVSVCLEPRAYEAENTGDISEFTSEVVSELTSEIASGSKVVSGELGGDSSGGGVEDLYAQHLS